jgi:hypothetical protein
MNLSAEELPVVRSILVANKVIDATASDGDVAAAHQAMLQSPSATEYKAQLEAGGVKTGSNWLTILGLVGGAVAIWLIWKNYQKPKQVSSHEYPEPEDVRPRIRSMGRALGAFRPGFGRHSLSRCGPRRMGQPPKKEYELETEPRLEGYRGRARR